MCRGGARWAPVQRRSRRDRERGASVTSPRCSARSPTSRRRSVSSAARSPTARGRCVRSRSGIAEAEGRAAFLSERNEKLAGTLREAREQLVTLKEEVDRLGAAARGYGVFLDRVTTTARSTSSPAAASCASRCRPNVEVEELQHGQEVMLNEAMNVVEARGFERAGEVVMLKELLEPVDGVTPRALVIGHTDEERVVYLADSLTGQPLRSRRLAAARDRGRATPTSGSRRARSRSSSSKRSPTSTTPTSAACPGRSSRSATPSSCRSCTPTCSASTSCARRRASCSTARPAAARR